MSYNFGILRRILFLMHVSSTHQEFTTLRKLIFWGTGTPRDIQQKGLPIDKVTVWGAV